MSTSQPIRNPGKLRMALLPVAMVCSAWITTPAHADYVVLTSGQTIHGEILERSRQGIRMRALIGDRWTTVNYRRDQYDHFIQEDGDQSDAGDGVLVGESESDSKSGSTIPVTKKNEEEPAPAEPAGPCVVVVPLHGSVGGIGQSGTLARTFDSEILEQCFEEALARQAELVILDVQSPGGMVFEMELICELIIEWHDKLRIVAFPDEAYSAAAIISLSCKELAVRPDSQFGAATIVTVDGSGSMDAVESKLASPHYAKQRLYMSLSEKPYEVVKAMTIQDTELWWHDEHGFTTDDPAQQPDAAAGWTRLDGPTEILTLTGPEALEYGVADFHAPSIDDLVAEVGVSTELPVVNLKDDIEKYNRSMSREWERLDRSITTYFDSLGRMVASLNALGEAYVNGSDEQIKYFKREFGKADGAWKRAFSGINTADRSLLARRVKVPDDLLAQMKSDRRTMDGIRRNANSGTVQGFNAAVDKINSVLSAWQSILYDVR